MSKRKMRVTLVLLLFKEATTMNKYKILKTKIFLVGLLISCHIDPFYWFTAKLFDLSKG